MSRNITILGAGPGGYVAALRAAQLGGRVTLIEKDKVGGTCLNRGCIPSKVMRATAEMLEGLGRAGEFGLVLEGAARADLAALVGRKNRVIEGQAREIHKLLGRHKIEYLEGAGRVLAPGLVGVDPAAGGGVEVPYDALILAPGSRPLPLPGLAFDGRGIISSDQALELTEAPGSLLVVGGGVIGCEFAFIYAALGSQVTVVEALDRPLPLPSIDEDCSKVIGREMKKRKIRFLAGRVVEGAEYAGDRVAAKIGPSPFLETPRKKEMAPERIEVDKVLVSVGRAPNTEDLGLERIGVELDRRGWIRADGRLAAGPGVFAIGDVLGPERIMLAHVASHEGLTAAANACGGEEVMDYAAVPGAVFTSPEVADVGLTEAQARDRGLDFRADSVLFRNIGKAQALGSVDGLAKIVSERGGGKVLGVHIVGPHATDLIAEGVLAVRTGLTVSELAGTIHAHPTLAEVMFETALKALDRPLHG
ncbi:MAG: dihydrolipoyl dehydrogenase [Thermodesulfobacteriota bacterium]